MFYKIPFYPFYPYQGKSLLGEMPDMPFLANLALICPIPKGFEFRTLVQILTGIVFRLVGDLRLPPMRTLSSPMLRIGTERRNFVLMMVVGMTASVLVEVTTKMFLAIHRCHLPPSHRRYPKNRHRLASASLFSSYRHRLPSSLP